VAAAPAPAAAEKVKPATGTVSERLFLSRDNHKDRRSETDLIFTTPVQNRSRSISEFTAHIICKSAAVKFSPVKITAKGNLCRLSYISGD